MLTPFPPVTNTFAWLVLQYTPVHLSISVYLPTSCLLSLLLQMPGRGYACTKIFECVIRWLLDSWFCFLPYTPACLECWPICDSSCAINICLSILSLGVRTSVLREFFSWSISISNTYTYTWLPTKQLKTMTN